MPIRRGTRSVIRTSDTMRLQPLYQAPVPIAAPKLNDLMTLCKTGVIKETYHWFYKSLKAGPDEPESEDD